ncbi:O-antigen ligase family protein [Micromonospora tulbaghiae]|uniref:O-antigen ligase family protein n=1 Tax=Micromonospora tulbaghiae TaxID=479978 RepID=UPI003409048D
MTPTDQPRLSPTWLTVLFLIALAGRTTPERLGLPHLPTGSDPRIPAYLLLAGVTLIWQVQQWATGNARPWPRFLIPFTALIAVQVASAGWAPPGARITEHLWDLGLLWLLVVCTAALTAPDPQRAARILLTLTLTAGIVYALAGIAAGPGLQGRVSAFGGGPNVFVRVVCLAAIAAVTLAVARRRWWLLAPIPLLAVAAVLSGSRGGLVAAVAAATIWFVFFLRRRRLPVLAATLTAGAVAGWAVWQFAGPALAALAGDRFNPAIVQANDYSGRPELLTVAWHMFTTHPVLGAGMDAFNAETGMNYPHNYLAGLAAETGITAVALLVWAIIRWCRDAPPWTRATPEQVGCAVAAVYILAASMFSGDYYDTRFAWLFAVVAVAQHHPRPHPTGQPKGIPWQGGLSSSTTTPNRSTHPAAPGTSNCSTGSTAGSGRSSSATSTT